MTFYDDPESAAGYIKLCEGYDAGPQLRTLYTALADGAGLLEIGSGPGNDLALLMEHYEVTGSDSSAEFIKHLTRRFPTLPILKLDAETLAVSGQFDVIYSNKVLHHLNDAGLAKSFKAQAKILNDGGLVYHLIWRFIDEMPDMGDLPFIARDASLIAELMEPEFEILSAEPFAEFADNDSLAILARKTNTLCSN
jgi:SAM-dependent methyltransferase